MASILNNTAHIHAFMCGGKRIRLIPGFNLESARLTAEDIQAVCDHPLATPLFDEGILVANLKKASEIKPDASKGW